MSEDTTRKLDERPFEERVFDELRNINQRLTALKGRFDALDEKVDHRLMETRPIWQAVQSSLEDISGQMRELSVDMLQMRSRVSRLEDRAHAHRQANRSKALQFSLHQLNGYSLYYRNQAKSKADF